MKNNNNTLCRIAIVASFCLATASVQAVTFDGTSSGTFQNPVGPGGMVVSGIGTSTVLFGDGANFGTGPSSLSFLGSAFSTPAETLFSLGQLTYFNGTTTVGSEMNNVDLQITLSFTSPSGLNEIFSYPLLITMTPNSSGSAAGDADFVTLPSFSQTVFTDAGINYTLEVGFGQFTGSGYILGNEFHVYENASATAPLVGRITENIPGVPDGGSTLLLLGGASALIGVLRRKLS